MIARDGDYVAYASGVVRDTKTGFEWAAGPDKDTTWHEAKRWVNILNVSGGGWRMSTINELKTLYEEGRGSRNTAAQDHRAVGLVQGDYRLLVGLVLPFLPRQQEQGLLRRLVLLFGNESSRADAFFPEFFM